MNPAILTLLLFFGQLCAVEQGGGQKPKNAMPGIVLVNVKVLDVVDYRTKDGYVLKSLLAEYEGSRIIVGINDFKKDLSGIKIGATLEVGMQKNSYKMGDGKDEMKLIGFVLLE